MAIDDDYVSIVPIGGFGPLNVVNTMLDLKILPPNHHTPEKVLIKQFSVESIQSQQSKSRPNTT